MKFEVTFTSKQNKPIFQLPSKYKGLSLVRKIRELQSKEYPKDKEIPVEFIKPTQLSTNLVSKDSSTVKELSISLTMQTAENSGLFEEETEVTVFVPELFLNNYETTEIMRINSMVTLIVGIDKLGLLTYWAKNGYPKIIEVN